MSEVFVFPSFSTICLIFLTFELIRNVIFWKEDFSFEFVNFNFINELLYIFYCLWNICENRFHFFLRFEIILLIGQCIPKGPARSYRIIYALVFFDAKQDIMCPRLTFVHIKHIIGSNDFGAVFFSESQ